MTSSPSIAQVNCGVELGVDCSPQTPNQQFICIDATQNQDVSHWIQQGMMQSYATSANFPQFLIIKGYLQISAGNSTGTGYSFAPNSEIIFADAASGIDVLSGASLTINGSYLHGCNSMWHYLRARSNASIIAFNSTIEDARYGIWGWADNSNIKAIGNTFKRNQYSIVLGDLIPLGPVLSIYSDGICGNTFIGQNQGSFGQPLDPQLLSNPWGISVPKAGILVEAPRNVTKIGEENGLMNEFKNYQDAGSNNQIFGIICLNANVTVVNSKITCSSGPDQSDARYGIYCESFKGIHLLTIKGLGSGTPMFENLRWGIASISNRIDVQDAFFLKNRFCIRQYYGNNSAPMALAPLRTKVKNCKFEDYYDVGVGVVGLQPLMTSQLQITDNEFVDGNTNTISNQSNQGFGDRFAIRVFSLATAELVNANISDNVITIMPVVGDNYIKGGIYLQNLRNLTIEGNSIFNDDDLYVFGSNFNGIHVGTCSKIRLYGNIVEGNNTTLTTPIDAVGIVNKDSESTELNCNVVDLVSKGIEFIGMGSDHAFMVQNKFNRHHVGGLYLQVDAVIGDQYRGENRWFGTNSAYEAYLEWDPNFGNYEPLNPLHRAIVAMRGIFSINSPGINNPLDTYWPSPRVVSNEFDNGVWFQSIPNGNPSGELWCIESHPGNGEEGGNPPSEGLSQGEQALLQDNYPTYNAGGYQWEAAFRLLGHLIQNEALRPAESLAALWYAEKQSTPLGALRAVYDEVQWLLAVTETQQQDLTQVLDSLETLRIQANSIASAIYAATTATETASLYLQRGSNTAETGYQMENYQNLVNAIRSAKLKQATNLLASLNGITTGNIFEHNLKLVLQTQLSFILAETPLMPAQIMTLESIASQCRYEGGWAVVMARQMLPENQYEDDALCNLLPSSVPANAASLKSDFEVWPNPVNDFLNVQINREYSLGTGRIFDLQGGIVHSIIFTGRTAQIRGMNLASGNYFIQVILDGQSLPVQKIGVNK